MGADELTGKTLGTYSILKKLGHGGMADVYQGYQESLGRYVAIKVLRPDLADNQDFLLRFRREALAVAKLSHPNILHLYDAGSAQGWYYIVMDYAEGGSLKDQLARGPLDVDRAVRIAIQIGEALDYAHRQGIVHRDVKPANILMTADSRPLLSDFGIAKALYDSTPLTRTGASIGTPDYMSPEQIQGRAVDGRTDIYALGVVLFEMLTGYAPFQATTTMATLYKQVNDPPPPLRQVNPATPLWLEAAVSRALAKLPDQRYQQAGDFARDLRQHQDGQTGPATAYPLTEVPAPRERTPTPAPVRRATAEQRRPAERRQSGVVAVLIGAIVVLLLALVGTGLYMFLGGPGGGPTATATPPIVVVVLTSESTSGSVATAVQDTTPSATANVVSPKQDAPTLPPTEPAATAEVVATAEPTDVPATEAPPTEVPATVPPTRPPATQPPPPTTAPGVIADFESFGTWKRGDQANGTFSQSGAQVHQGAYAGRLDYQFTTAGNDYVVFQQARPIGGGPTRLTAWVYGDGSGHFLNAWIKDKAGQIWQVPLGTVSHSGWQQMAGALDVTQPWPWTHIGGPDNGVIDYPVSFVALVLDDKPDTFNGSGTIYIDELRADTGTVETTGGQPVPTAQPTAAAAGGAGIAGRIAFSAGGVLHIVDAKTGQERAAAGNMRQPDFRADGQLLIANGEGGGHDSLWSVRPGGALEGEQSTHPEDSRPFFSPSNPNRFVYDSRFFTGREDNLFVGNLNSKLESRQPLPFGSRGIVGSRPVWLSNDQIVYTGCDYGFGTGGNCGLYTVPSSGGQPSRILPGDLTDYATDGSGAQVLVTTRRDGNWELYIMSANGGGLRNLSSSPGSQDGLGTFSPDGKWVAFVSNRDGGWAIWAMRPDGSGLSRLFNMPAPPTGTWTDERISWAP